MPYHITVNATKASRQSRVGISVQNAAISEGGGVFITSIWHNSIFANTALKEGMIIEAINGIDCAFLTSSDVATMLREAEREVTIVAKSTTINTRQYSCRGSAQLFHPLEMGLRGTKLFYPLKVGLGINIRRTARFVSSDHKY